MGRPELVTRKNVEIIEVGTNWHASTGDITITHEHLVAAVAAMDDPAVRAPIIKLGHVDGRFNARLNEDGSVGDGQPAFGKLENLHLSEDGMTLLADEVGIPRWLDEAMPSAYPRRSFEGWFNLTTATGRTHGLVITGLALLGEAYPAITTLEDIQAIYEASSIDELKMITASIDEEALFVTATQAPVRREKLDAAINVDDVRRQYYESLTSEQMWWWIREQYVDPPQLIVDDDDGTLYRVTYTTDGDSVEFSDPVPVQIVYQDTKVAASSNRPCVVYATKDASRTDTLANSAQEDALTKEQLEKLGLAEDATPEQIDEALDKLVTASAGQVSEGEVTEGDEDDDPQADEETPVQPITPAPDDTTVTVDKEVFAGLQVAAQQAGELWRERERQRRDGAIEAAIKSGRIFPARRAHWQKQWDADPEGAAQTLASLEPVVPLTEIGHGDTGEQVAEDATAYPTQYLTASERERIRRNQEAAK